MFKHSIDEEEANIRKIEQLYNKYKGLMYKEANNILKDEGLSEDAVHQAFLKLIKNINKIDENDEKKTRNFLVIICKNTAIDIYKKRLYLNQSSDSIDFEMEESEDNASDYREPSRIVIDKEMVQEVANQIDKLPQIYKDVILLEKLHNYTKEEIAELLDLNYETVRKRSLRARKMLMQSIAKEGNKNNGR